ncbi:MAG TPA: 30S ribosomal protein S15 [Candidatus Absconditabacterales bacterium]|nr:30S ribosomal protein S15 [Candidatus Absconditabacterales bacterium]HMT26815.1 30S ribosomal protein S15 [Candidatus Absconditabacterales bacterium]
MSQPIDQKKLGQVKRHDSDSGSPEVQIAHLNHEIDLLQAHLNMHKHDVDAKRSLLKKVARRRKHVKYLKEHDLERFSAVGKKLGLKDAA